MPDPARFSISPVLCRARAIPARDGFEISVPAQFAERLVTNAARRSRCAAGGPWRARQCAARGGLCLYGHDIDTTTTPVEAALEWSIQKTRRKGGVREGGFPGADIILKELESGAVRRRVCLKAEGRAPVREGAMLFADETSSDQIGTVTSGGFGAERQRSGCNGLRPDAAFHNRYTPVRRGARTAAASARRQTSLCRSHLSTLRIFDGHSFYG